MASCTMALSSISPSQTTTPTKLFIPAQEKNSPFNTVSCPKIQQNPHQNGTFSTSLASSSSSLPSHKWRTNVSFFPAFLGKKKDATPIKEELLEAIAPLDRGAEATPEDQERVDRIARKLEAVNPTKEPLKSELLDGKWELIYTTSESILQTKRPKFLRSKTNYQGINTDTLRAQNMESAPFFNQVTADLAPLNAKKVAVKFDYFKIGGLIPIKAPDTARGELEITYLDEELRVSRGDKGNLFILKMVDPSYRGNTVQRAHFDFQMHYFLMQKNFIVAHQLFEWLVNFDSNIEAHQKQLKLLAETRGTRAAAEMYFNSLHESAKNVITYAVLLRCYCKDKMLNKALEY
ncbi:OLC1v1002484C2 [Oldenlandia corymbosa var. corymbosa]|uniref:OLC1v1002484C2 n=1 Tax=Oldenlandia corymbosa var. corymbosa TaxID=529605 RepID=A0AAV1D9C8_OLDCO|nr:OLC1v1002484C2 [Oldenlandia corymbosa var. corymbosa]